MNLHPVFVHFPIALLTIYALLELIWWKKAMSQPWWWYVKAFLVILGVLTAFAALATGDDDFVRTTTPQFYSIVEAHETVAGTATTVFGIIAFGYLIAFVAGYSAFVRKNKLLSAINGFLQSRWLLFLLALAGLVLISATGALGGTLAYGCDLESATQLVCLLFPA